MKKLYLAEKKQNMLRCKYLFLFIVFAFTCIKINAQVKYFKLPARVADSDYIVKTIIFKINSNYSAFCKENNVDMPKLNSALNSIGANKVIKKCIFDIILRMKTIIVNIPEKEETFFLSLLKKFHFKSRVLSDEELEDKELAKVINEAMKSEDVSEQEIFDIFRRHGIKV